MLIYSLEYSNDCEGCAVLVVVGHSVSNCCLALCVNVVIFTGDPKIFKPKCPIELHRSSKETRIQRHQSSDSFLFPPSPVSSALTPRPGTSTAPSASGRRYSVVEFMVGTDLRVFDSNDDSLDNKIHTDRYAARWSFRS